MEDDDIPDTRVFVSGLPPHYTSEQLGAHFAGRYQITDSVVIPNRRIGFVGFRNYTLAKNAVKYFDKSYIRMSKISVDVAKPVDFHRELNAESDSERQDASEAQTSKKPLSVTASRSTKSAFKPYEPVTTNISSKRKRADEEDQSKAMEEYMEVMQPKSKSTWANGESISKAETIQVKDSDKIAEPNKTTKTKKEKRTSKKDNEPVGDATEASDVERKRRKKEKKEKRLSEANDQTPDAEAALVDKLARKKRKAEKKAKKLEAEPTAEGGVEPLNDDASGVDDAETDIAQPKTTRSDNDWLHGKTSRLLDLVDPDEQIHSHEKPQRKPISEPAEFSDGHESMNVDTEPEDEAHDVKTANTKDVSIAKTVTVTNGRLFIRNLPFSTTEFDLESKFARYGSIVEVHVSKDFKSSSSKGMAFVQFTEPGEAERALRTLDGTTFQGRLLHILPASDKKASQLDEFTLSKLPLKKQKAIKQKKDASSASFSWNSLYMNPDAVLASVANRLGISKSEVLDPTSSDAAVKQALAETNTIKDTKNYLQNNGVSIDAFKNARRDDRTMLLKNFSFGTTSDDLRALLDPFGSITKFVLPPTGTMAIAQYEDPHMSAKALKHLAYRNLNGSVLFLEKAPEGIFDVSESAKESHHASKVTVGAAVADDSLNMPDQASATVFVRNLNFATTTSRLAEVFKPLPGYLSATVKTRTDPKRPGEILSMGFGFIEFKSKDQAAAAIIAMNGYKLEGHELLVKASTRVLDAAEETRRADKSKKTETKTKIIIKNLPFEASKKDIRALFGAYGQLRTVRVPKKFDQSTRGFAFADFVTAKEAENAMEALTNTHLLGRRLVLQFAAGDATDPEEEIQALERKMGQQSEMVNLSKLTGSGRRKFNVEAQDGDEQL